MERREFIAGVTTLVATTAAAQTPTIFGQAETKPSEEELSAAYKVCRQRGHVSTAWGNTHGATFTNAVFIAYPDRPSTGYVEKQEGPWDTCFYCKKQFRFVTTQEEK